MNDTSDKAFQEYWWNRIYKGSGGMSLAKEAWQECRRRCEAGLNVQAEQHIETLAKAMADNVRLMIEKKKLEAQMEELKETIEGHHENLDHYRASSKQWMEAYQTLKAQMEERERKAFMAGWHLRENGGIHVPGDAYRAFRDQNK